MLFGLGLIIIPNLATIGFWVLQLTTWFVMFIVGPFMMVFLPYSIYLDIQSQKGLTLAQRVGGAKRMRMYVYGKSGSKWHS